MTAILRWTMVGLFLATTLLPTWSQSSHSHLAGDANADPAWSAFQISMEQMHAAMNGVVPSGNSDEDFVRLMLPHHQAAIDMAKAQLLHGKDPQMQRLAQEIITDQQSEIELMQLWLKQHTANTKHVQPTHASLPSQN